MKGRFGQNTHFSAGSMNRTHRRQQLLLVTATGITFSFCLILIFVFNFGSDTRAVSELKSNDHSTVTQLGMVALLTPERDIRQGEPLSNVRLKEIYWPRNKIPNGAVRNVAEIRDMTAKVNISSAVPLVYDDMTKDYIQTALQPAPGHRVMSIEVDQTSGIEGHARPGMNVDVVLTYTDHGLLTTRIIVENARILSTDGDTTNVNEMTRTGNVARHPSRTISLDVAVQDALKIQTARQLGKLNLMLRSAGDTAGVQHREITFNDISGHSAPEKPKPGCSLGRVKEGGREFMVDCSGKMTEITRAEP